MKKYILPLVSLAALLGSCEVEDKYYGKEVEDISERLKPAYELDWTANADKTTAVLIDKFMNTSKGTFWVTDNDRLSNSTYSYWPQAHAMDVVVDAYNRISADDARKGVYANYMKLWHQNRANNYSSPGFHNDFTDDMEWIVLTLIRMHEATGEAKYLTSAQETYDLYIRTRFSGDVAAANGVIDPNGNDGFRWYYTSGRPLQNPDNGSICSVNACSNGPGILCAMRLRANISDEGVKEKYLADAKRSYNWLVSTLYNAKTGAVADNMTNGVIGGGPLSYNQGTFLGAAYELYKATGDKKYLVETARAARYNMTSMVSNGVLKNEGDDDDNALFKGIFVRYAMNVWKDASVDKVDATLRNEIRDFLIYNGLICWTKGVDQTEGSNWFFGAFWGDRGSSWDGKLNPQVSASTMIEAMALLIKK